MVEFQSKSMEPLHSLNELIENLKRQNQLLSELTKNIDNIGNRIRTKEPERVCPEPTMEGLTEGIYNNLHCEIKEYAELNDKLRTHIMYVEQYI